MTILHHLTRRLSPLGLAVSVTLAAIAPLPAQAQALKPLVHGIPNDINSIDPADSRGSPDQEIMLNIYERLVRIKYLPQPNGSWVADPVAVEPELAESWTIDGAVITFKLRKDVKFYPTGNPLTSEDFRYAFQRLVEIPANGKNQAGIAGIFTADQVETPDPYTLKITFKDGPNGKPTLLPVSLTSMKFMQFAAVDSAELKKRATPDDPWAREWTRKNLSTTGPYYIASRTPNVQLNLKEVPDHKWGINVPFKEVVLRIIGNADIVALIKGGVVDFAADGITGRQYDALAQAGFPVLHSGIPDILKISFAMDKEPFTDKRVRQAVLHAIPTERIIKTALSGRGKRATCVFNPDDPTCNDSFARYDYNLDKAKALLAEAGMSNLSFDFWYSTSLPYNNDIAILIADALKQIGVTMNLKPTPALQLQEAYRARIDGKSETMTGVYLSEATFWLADPSTLTNTSIITKSPRGGSGNWARYSDPEVDELHFTYRNSNEEPARTAAYRKIQDKLADCACNIVPLIVMGRTIVTSKRVVGAMFSQEPYARYAQLKPKK